jgi:hypothetical protein
MNLQQMRERAIRQTGRYDLCGVKSVNGIDEPDFTVDRGMDYFLNEAQRWLDENVAPDICDSVESTKITNVWPVVSIPDIRKLDRAELKGASDNIPVSVPIVSYSDYVRRKDFGDSNPCLVSLPGRSNRLKQAHELLPFTRLNDTVVQQSDTAGEDGWFLDNETDSLNGNGELVITVSAGATIKFNFESTKYHGIILAELDSTANVSVAISSDNNIDRNGAPSYQPYNIVLANLPKTIGLRFGILAKPITYITITNNGTQDLVITNPRVYDSDTYEISCDVEYYPDSEILCVSNSTFYGGYSGVACTLNNIKLSEVTHAYVSLAVEKISKLDANGVSAKLSLINSPNLSSLYDITGVGYYRIPVEVPRFVSNSAAFALYNSIIGLLLTNAKVDISEFTVSLVSGDIESVYSIASPHRSWMIYPAPSENKIVTIHCSRYSPELKDNSDESHWSMLRPGAVVNVAQMIIEGVHLNPDVNRTLRTLVAELQRALAAPSIHAEISAAGHSIRSYFYER